MTSLRIFLMFLVLFSSIFLGIFFANFSMDWDESFYACDQILGHEADMFPTLRFHTTFGIAVGIVCYSIGRKIVQDLLTRKPKA